ncbi:hypothetical protein L218DRAFT_1081754, partial [Marasmius fiardii PR-910]
MDQLPFANQDTEMSVLPSTINPQILHNEFMVGNLVSGGEKFTTSPNLFKLPISEYPRRSHLPDGLFLARVDNGFIDHLHNDHSMCNLVQCLSLAKTEKDPGWMAEMDKMEEYFSRDACEEADHIRTKLDRAIDDLDDARYELKKVIKQRNEARSEVSKLQEHISQLEKLVERYEKAEPKVSAGSKRKATDSDQMEVDTETPRPSKRLTSSEVTIPSVDFSMIDSSNRPEPCPDVVLIKFARFRPRFPLHRAVGLMWSDSNGSIQVSHQMRGLIKRSQIPPVLPMFGSSSGFQVPPSEYSELSRSAYYFHSPSPSYSLFSLHYDT